MSRPVQTTASSTRKHGICVCPITSVVSYEVPETRINAAMTNSIIFKHSSFSKRDRMIYESLKKEVHKAISAQLHRDTEPMRRWGADCEIVRFLDGKYTETNLNPRQIQARYHGAATAAIGSLVGTGKYVEFDGSIIDNTEAKDLLANEIKKKRETYFLDRSDSRLEDHATFIHFTNSPAAGAFIYSGSAGNPTGEGNVNPLYDTDYEPGSESD